MIVEGATCHAGTIATYIIDLNNRKQIRLPTNAGFIGFTTWNVYIIACEKMCVDPDFPRYENVYIIDWDGNVVSSSSSEDYIIENSLLQIHLKAGLDINNIKLSKHIALTPKYDDESFFGRQYEISYTSLTDESIKKLEELCQQSDNWEKRGAKFHYHDIDDYNWGLLVNIIIDPHKKTGIIRKCSFSNPKNVSPFI